MIALIDLGDIVITLNNCGTGAGGFQPGNTCAAGDGLQSMVERIRSPDGGFTYQPLSEHEPSVGYALSIHPERSFAKDADELEFEDVLDYVVKNEDLLSQKGSYLGAWHDPESGKVFLDISRVTDDEDEARDLALVHDQIAYFDLGKGMSVTVNPEATSGGVTNVRQASSPNRWAHLSRKGRAALQEAYWQRTHARTSQSRREAVDAQGVTWNDCGTGAGGFQPGNTCASGGGSMASAVRGKDGKLTLADGSPLPDHLPKKIPPAWTDVTVSLDPEADLLVKGKDSKGRVQSVYSDTHHARQAAAKFSKISELRAKMPEIESQILEDVSAGVEPAVVARLIQVTGLRPGSDRDTAAEKKAYGATTLEGRHVKVLGSGKVQLEFTGKKGVDLKIPVEDPDLAAELRSRSESAGRKGRLFETNDKDLRDYFDDLDGGKFNPKDFRTAKGTSVAASLVSKRSPPKDMKSYKAAVKEVATKVSKTLGNTPTVALQSYIDPNVFAAWRPAK